MLSVRASSVPPPPTVITEPDGIEIVPLPESEPPFQLKAVVTVSDCVPFSVPPLIVSVETVTGISRVIVYPGFVAVSPAPGTPAPPHVEELLQLPDCVAVNDVAESGVVAAKANNANTTDRVTK